MLSHWKINSIIYKSRYNQIKLVINMLKTKEIVCHRPNPRDLVLPPPLTNTECIKFAKLLGFNLWITLVRVNKLIILIKISNKRLYLLNQLKKRYITLYNIVLR